MLAKFFLAHFRESLIPLTLLCAASLAPFSHADEPPLPQARQVRLESGRVVEYTIPFDRNALQASERTGNGLIALTSSGVLLRFELPDVRLVRERGESVEVKHLGRGEGDAVLAGLADGRICRVNPATLELTEIAKLPAPALWIGWISGTANRPGGLVVVTGSTKSTVHDVATGKTLTVEFKATTFLSDSAGRLWLGADNGEWGGQVARVDLTKGTNAIIDPPPSRNPRRRPVSGKVFTASSSCEITRYGLTAARCTWVSVRERSRESMRINRVRSLNARHKLRSRKSPMRHRRLCPSATSSRSGNPCWCSRTTTSFGSTRL